MAKIQPYDLVEAQTMVSDAVHRADKRHGMWRALEYLYRTGQAMGGSVGASDVPDRLWTDLPGLTLDGINLVLAHMNIIKATAMARDPAFLVEAWTGGDAASQNAKKSEELLKYLWDRQDGTDTARDMTQDLIHLGNGFCKVSWAFIEAEVERPDDEMEAELEQLMEVERRDALLSGRSPKPADELVSMVEAVVSKVMRDEPVVQYVSPFDIFVPTNARRMSETRWVAERLILPRDEVEANDKFSRRAKQELASAKKSDRPGDRPDDEEAGQSDVDLGSGRVGDGPAGKNADRDPMDEVTIYEFYDMRTRTMKVFQLDAEHALFEGDIPYSHRHPPYIHMRNFEDGGNRFWAFGDLENVASIQEEHNQYLYEQMANARRAGNKTLIDKNSWDDQLKEFLESEQGDIAMPIDPKNNRLEDVVHNIERQSLPADIYQAKAELQKYMEDVLGLTDLQTGGLGPSRMSATTAAVADGNSTLRSMDKKHQVERAVAQMGLLIVLLSQEFLSEEKVVRVLGPDGSESWLNVTPEDIRGEFGVRVEAGSTQAVNPATRQQRAIETITQILPVLVELGYDEHSLLRQAIRDYGYNPDDVLRKLPPQPGPSQGPTPPSGPGGGQAPPGAQATGHPAEAGEQLGGPPVPAATGGDIGL